MITSEAVLIVIPARYASSRFPGKPLADIAGRPMIAHVIDRCRASCGGEARVLVATDSTEIADAARACGAEARMTPPELPSGTERVAYAARGEAEGIIVNVQGDEPLLDPRGIDTVVGMLRSDPSFDIATLASPISAEEAADPNIVKAVVALDGHALYFSRARIPHARDEAAPAVYLGHIGLYGFRRDALLRFASLPPSALEDTEKLEQLRALDHGMRIGVGRAARRSPAVDVPSDIARVLEALHADASQA